MKKTLLKYFTVFLMFSFIILLFWFKFLRTRSPRNIPFHLELSTFFLLLFSCAILIFSLYICFSKKSYMPLDQSRYLENFIRDRFFIKESFLLYFSEKPINTIKIINSWILLIRYIILLFFLLDVFFFEKIFYSYSIVFLLLPVYLFKFYFFSYQQLLKEKYDFMTDKYQILWGGIIGGVENIEDCVVAQNKILDNGQKPFRILFLLSPRYSLELTQNFVSKQGQKFNSKPYLQNAKNVFEQCLKIQKIIMLNHIYRKDKKVFFSLLLIIYLLTWLYILVISLHTLELRHFLQLMKLFENIKNNIDYPF